jgi:alkylhydroperoxidase/carboxymuconolactone decarboxylase family protein YurZ
VKAYGRIDVMLNNAGLMPQAPLELLKVDEWDRMIDVNIKGVLYGIAAALPYMKEQKDEAAEAQRAARVGEQLGEVAPGIVHYTTDVLFRDFWLRPGLAPRYRCLIAVSALVATGQVAQITYHMNRAMDTKEQAGEVVTHLAFYAGWPNAFSAQPVVKQVFAKHPS